MAAAHGALHKSGQRFGVLAGERDALEARAHDGPEARHLSRAVHGVAASGVALVRPGRRGSVRGAKRSSFGVDTIELALEARDALRIAQAGCGARWSSGDELGEQA